MWLHSPAIPRGRSRKLHCPWTGPYRVVRKLSNAVYRIQHARTRRKRLVVHFDRLKRCAPGTRLPVLPSDRVQESREPPIYGPTPVGTDLEMVEDDPGDILLPGRAVAHPTPPVMSEPLHRDRTPFNPVLSAPRVPRYPRRNRTQPDRYTQLNSGRISELCSVTHVLDVVCVRNILEGSPHVIVCDILCVCCARGIIHGTSLSLCWSYIQPALGQDYYIRKSCASAFLIHS